MPRIDPKALKKVAAVSPRTSKLYQDVHEPLFAARPSSLGFPSEVAQSTYYPGIVRIKPEEVERVSRILEKRDVYPENTRIEKIFEDGQTVYKVLQASTDTDSSTSHLQISIPGSSDKIVIIPGDHADELKKVCQYLEKGKQYAANSQQKAVIDQYLETFKTGEVEAFKESQRLWVKDLQPTVENAFGFVEPYRDPHGTRAEFEGIVAFVNAEETRVLTKLVESSAEYICDLPWAENATENNGKGLFEKELFEPPDFTSLQSMYSFFDRQISPLSETPVMPFRITSTS